jgi:hypothetical protein
MKRIEGNQWTLFLRCIKVSAISPEWGICGFALRIYCAAIESHESDWIFKASKIIAGGNGQKKGFPWTKVAQQRALKRITMRATKH